MLVHIRFLGRARTQVDVLVELNLLEHLYFENYIKKHTAHFC